MSDKNKPNIRLKLDSVKLPNYIGLTVPDNEKRTMIDIGRLSQEEFDLFRDDHVDRLNKHYHERKRIISEREKKDI